MQILIISFVSWVLTRFDMDIIIISAINEVLGTTYSTNVYWLIVFVIGAASHIMKHKNKKSEH